MEKIVSALIAQTDNPVVILLAAILAIALWVAYKIVRIATQWQERSRRFDRWDDNIDAIRRDISEMKGLFVSVDRRFDEVDRRIARMDEHISGLDGQIRAISHRMDNADHRLERMESLFRRTPASPTQTASPLKIGPVGEQIAIAINADEILAQHGEQLGAIIKAQNPTHAYDVQEACLELTKNALPDLLTPQQRHAVKTQSLEHNIPQNFILEVVVLPLRDKLLQELNLPMDGSNPPPHA